MKRKLAALLAALLLLGLAGCGKKENTGTEQKGSGITCCVGTAIFEDSMDPIKGAMSHGFPFVCSALLRVTPDSDYVGDLADRWEISNDGLTYTFHLKENIVFSDGSPLTAEDVVFTYEQVMDRQAENQNVDLTRLDSVAARDDYTVVFTLKERYSPFFDTTAKLQIVPSDSYDSELFDRAPIGTGAWVVAQHDPNQQIILTANEKTHGRVPAIPKVTLVRMDPDAAFAAARSGQLDLVMVGEGYAREEIPGMTLIPLETMDVRNISLPVQPEHTVIGPDGSEATAGNNVTSDPAVRRALTIGIDRQQIIDYALNGVGRPAMRFTDNLVWAAPSRETDGREEEALALLEQAGWTDGDGDGIREKNGLRCSFSVLAPSGDQERYQLAAALAENAARLGIEIRVESQTWDEIFSREYSDGVVWGWGQFSPTVLRSLYDSRLFMTGMFDNVAGFSDPGVDALIDKALAASDPDSAAEIWKQVQEEADAQCPYLFLVNIEHCYFVREGLDLSPDTQIPHPHGHGIPVICNMEDWEVNT